MTPLIITIIIIWNVFIFYNSSYYMNCNNDYICKNKNKKITLSLFPTSHIEMHVHLNGVCPFILLFLFFFFLDLAETRRKTSGPPRDAAFIWPLIFNSSRGPCAAGCSRAPVTVRWSDPERELMVAWRTRPQRCMETINTLKLKSTGEALSFSSSLTQVGEVGSARTPTHTHTYCFLFCLKGMNIISEWSC